MSEIRFPFCPICNQEILLPFSSIPYVSASKTFSYWLCSNCGFYLKTVDNRRPNPEKDVKAGFHLELRKKILEMKELYQKTKSS